MWLCIAVSIAIYWLATYCSSLFGKQWKKGWLTCCLLVDRLVAMFNRCMEGVSFTSFSLFWLSYCSENFRILECFSIINHLSNLMCAALASAYRHQQKNNITFKVGARNHCSYFCPILLY